jgi:Protein of unknown function (DUF1571)
MYKKDVLCKVSVLCAVAMLAVFVCVRSGFFADEKKSDRGDRQDSKEGPLWPENIRDLAVNDHIGLLKHAIKTYEEEVVDYTGTFGKQERIGGKLGDKQIISFKFKQKPYSLLMKWKQNPGAADKLLYVEGQHDGDMIIHPTGLMSWIKSVRRDPAGKEALKGSLNPCYKFGFYRTMKSILEAYEKAKERGDLTANFLGETTVDKRPCLLLERLFPEKKIYPYARLVMAIDMEYLVPVHLKASDWKGNLYFDYLFEDLRFNAGLGEESFTPKANGL